MENMTKFLPALLGLALLPALSLAAEPAALSTEAEKVSYSVGYQVGGDFQRQGWEISPDALVQGLRDAIAKNTPRLTQEEMNLTLGNLKKKLVAEQQAARKQTDAAFLAANAKQPGVTVLPSGVQYRVLQAGSGKKPTAQDSVTILYRVSRTDGKQIGSTEPGKPKTYPVAKAIPDLQEALQLMAEGAKWQIVIPSGLATGDREPLDDAGVIIYDLELVSVQSAT
jgi:FKBP-type peptidyl-prolyl cis-trans isomerase FklB